MSNFLYLIICLLTIGFIYFIIMAYKFIAFEIYKNKKQSKKKIIKSEINTIKTTVNKLKKKFNIGSSEPTFINNNNEYINNINNLHIINVPTNLVTIDHVIQEIPIEIINKFKLKCVNENIIKTVLISFFNAKFYFNKLFLHNEKLIINNNNNFIKLYKNFINKKIYGYNICLKLFRENDSNQQETEDCLTEQFIYMKDYTLIKIKNNTNLKLIYNNIKNNNIFILKKESKYYISIGNSITTKINNNEISNLFFNKNLVKNINKINYDFFSQYNNLTIFYWVSSPIIFD